MAIQPNRRKRKHEEPEAEQPDDGEVAVPKKVPKESNTPKKKKERKASKTEGAEEATGETPPETNGTESEDPSPSKKKAKKPETSTENEAQQVETEVSESPSKKPRHRKDKQQDEDEISPDSGIEPEESHLKFPNDFKMMQFRTKLRSNCFITGK